MLHAQVDRELHRLLQPVGRKPCGMQRREPVAVEPLLDAGDALVVDVDEADQVRDLGAVRIGALVLGEKAETRKAELVDFLLLLRGDLALEPGEAAFPVAEPLAHFLGVEIRHHGGEEFDRLVHVDQPLRLAEQRRHPHVGREDLAPAIDNVRARGRDRIGRAGAAARRGCRAPPRRARGGPR